MVAERETRLGCLKPAIEVTIAMNSPDIGTSATEGRSAARRRGARVTSMVKGVASALDLTDVILIVGPPMVAAVVLGFGDLMTRAIRRGSLTCLHV